MKPKLVTCPCEGCLCVPICSNKIYNDLINQCFLIREYLIEPYRVSKRPIDRLQKVEKNLQPQQWGIDIIGGTQYYIKQF